MITHVLPRMACVCAMLVVALTHCGCISIKGPSGWASKPKPSNANQREVVSYWGQKKQEPKPIDKEELRNRMAQGAKESQQSSFESYLKQGNLALRENRLDDARREYERGLELRPNDPDCHHRLAVVADKEGQFGLADDHYEAALKLRPRDANLLSDMGYSYSLRGDDRRAESTLNQALSISPSNQGAMGNLGAIYARQGRYEDAVAMLRKGGTPEAKAQYHLAQWFPQRQDSPFSNVAQNSPPASASPGERQDVAGMNAEQLKELMNRKKAEGIQQRQQQYENEDRVARDRGWMDPPHQQQPQYAGTQQNGMQPNGTQPNQPIIIGPGSNPSLPIVTPKGGNPSGIADNNPYGQGNTGGQFAPNGPGTDQFRAPRGTTPNIDEWNGAGANNRSVDMAGGIDNNPFNRRSVNPANGYQPSQPSGQNQPGTIFRGPPQQPANGQQFDQNPNASSASMAAAQLGMSIGPGGLFPLAPADGGSGGPANFSNSPIENRAGHEFPSPPQFQGPPNQYQPSRTAFSPGDPRQGSTGPSRGSFGGVNENDPLAPPSPTSNWSQNGQQTVQAGATSNSANPRFGADPFERFPSAAESNWADKPNLNGAAPFNGTWPPNSQPANTQTANAGNGTPNQLPMWNGGQTDNRPQPKQYGTASNYPEQWPHTQPR